MSKRQPVFTPEFRERVKQAMRDGLTNAECCRQFTISVMSAWRLREELAIEPPTTIQSGAAAEAITRYRHEKARRAERLAQRPEIHQAKADFAALLDREKAKGRGGRPKGSKNGGNSLAGQCMAKPGKPQIVAQKPNAVDALWQSLPVYQGGA